MRRSPKFAKNSPESERRKALKTLSRKGSKVGKMQRKKMLKVFSECFSRRKCSADSLVLSMWSDR